ncbi:MAG TPA: Hsp33 family molecular chaperone HslO [Rhizomicrobium sp.]
MTSPSQYTPAPAADFVLPFDLAPLGVRGRLVRLSGVSAEALTAHKLPEPAARVAAETLTLSALLGSALKLDGRLTVQTKSDGALDLIVSDYYGAEEGRPAGVRGYARADDARVAALARSHGFVDLAGAGSLGITIEPRLNFEGIGGQSYQGIVELSPDGIAASAQTYFEQSEQLPTAIRLAAAPVFEPGKPVMWRAGGIMLQRTAEAARADDAKNDDWERLKMFIATVEDFELVDTALKAEDLLWRLFHEDEVRVLPFEPIAFRCDCSVARIEGVLKGYAPEDRRKLADPDGVIRARCEFCGKTHEIHPTLT